MLERQITYIFERLGACDSVVKSVRKALRRQERFNRTVAAFALVAAAYMVMQNAKNRRLDEKIKELTE
jgi:hypothetical protein